MALCTPLRPAAWTPHWLGHTLLVAEALLRLGVVECVIAIDAGSVSGVVLVHE